MEKIVELLEKFLVEVIEIKEHLGDIADAMYESDEVDETEVEDEPVAS